MLKFCVEKREKNNKLLEDAIEVRTDLNTCCYKDLVEYIFNDGHDRNKYDYIGNLFRTDRITEINVSILRR